MIETRFPDVLITDIVIKAAGSPRYRATRHTISATINGRPIEAHYGVAFGESCPSDWVRNRLFCYLTSAVEATIKGLK